MKKIVFIGLALILIAGTAFAEKAEQKGKRQGRLGLDRQGWVGHRQEMNKMLKEKLDLDQGQIRKIEKLTLTRKKEMIQLKASERVARIELFELLAKLETDENELEDQLNKISRLTAKIQKSHIRHILEIKKVLAKDQLEKFSGMKPFGFMGMGHGPQGPGPMGCGKR